MLEQSVLTATAPWWAKTAVVLAPGAAAVTLTVASVVLAKRVNRADGHKPLSVRTTVLYTLFLGAIWGPLMAWGLQTLVYQLAGLHPDPRLLIVATLITGIASLIAYDLLRWWTKDRYTGLYALVSVKHYDEQGDDGDLTRIAKEDVTEPKP
jgi:hypothetical protein